MTVATPSSPGPGVNALVADAIACERGGRLVLDQVSLRVDAGETLILTGPNGAGKSTFLRVLAGLIRPLAGEVRFEGLAEDTEPGEALHYAGHQEAVKSQLSVAENLGFWADWFGADADAIETAADVFGLTALLELPAAFLSAGQRHRLSLARLLLGDRPVWLLDEPTVALDRASRERLFAAMAGHTARGGLTIVATHEPIGIDGARTVEIGALSAS